MPATAKKQMTITEEPSTTYKIRDLPEGGWADITLREWEGGGTFMCTSDFGEFNYVWGSIGERTLREFLCGLDKQYFMKKTRAKDYMLFDVPLTCKGIKEEILRKRKERDLNEEEARTCWEDVGHLAGTGARTPDAFLALLRTESQLENILWAQEWIGDALDIRERYNPMCDLFWDRVWPRITAYWKENKCHS